MSLSLIHQQPILAMSLSQWLIVNEASSHDFRASLVSLKPFLFLKKIMSHKLPEVKHDDKRKFEVHL